MGKTEWYYNLLSINKIYYNGSNKEIKKFKKQEIIKYKKSKYK
jgi:hypothetical protein